MALRCERGRERRRTRKRTLGPIATRHVPVIAVESTSSVAVRRSIDSRSRNGIGGSDRCALADISFDSPVDLTDVRAAAMLGRVASWGYVVVASQYRGNAGGEGKEEFGGKDVNDVLHLIPLLESLPRADGKRIGMYGWSRGGMMTYLALTKTDRIASAVVGSGAADAFDNIQRRPEMEKPVYAELIPDYAEHKEAALAARSAVRWPEKLHKQTPILLLHGSADWRVHPTEALTTASKLFESKHPFRFVFFEGGDHGLTEHREEVDRLIRNWLDRYVRDKKPWPSLEPHGP